MASRRAQVQEDVRYRVPRLLSANPEMSQRELAEAAGISLGSVHYVLAALVEKGLIKLAKFRSASDKRRYAYILTPCGFAEKASITHRFLARKVEEYEVLRMQIEDLQREVEFGAELTLMM